MLNLRFSAIAAAILAAAAARLVPHPPNFTPVAAMALFAGAYVPNRALALVLPLGALFVTDLVLGFYPGLSFVYLGFAAVVGIGFLLNERRTPLRVGAAALSASALFFVISNFGTWLSSGMYSHSLGGLELCYVMAVPFFRNTVLGDLFYAVVLFGGFALLEQGWPRLREQSRAQQQAA